MVCNGSQGGISGAAAPAPDARNPTCRLCSAPITGTVYVELLNLRAIEPVDGWDEDYWVAEEVCGACFGEWDGRPVRYTVACAHCGRRVAASVHVEGAPRTYCWGGCRWDAHWDRLDEQTRQARTKVCGWCGAVFVAARADARWCSVRCRVAGHRAARRSLGAGNCSSDTNAVSVTSSEVG